MVRGMAEMSELNVYLPAHTSFFVRDVGRA